jgi:hypothetical protein
MYIHCIYKCVCAPICVRTYVITCAMYVGPICICMCTYVQMYVLCIQDPLCMHVYLLGTRVSDVCVRSICVCVRI